MAKYKTKIKVQLNFYKDIEVIADNDIQAKQKIMELSSNLLDDCRKVIEENDKDIKRNMSYWDYNKIEEVKENIVMNKEKKEQLLIFIESAIKHLNNIQESVKKIK